MTTGTSAPIIILGMHRSGTSLVARVLERLGLFVGRRTEHNHEAWFFLRLNDWLLAQAAGRWDHPEPIGHLLDNPDVRAQTVRYLRDLTRSGRMISYLGWLRFLRYRDPTRLPGPWGWKDPRNTFTLPIWRDVFPAAKIIHVRRHGVDVANSVMTRKARSFEAAAAKYQRHRRWYWLAPKAGGFADTLRITSLDDAFDLWDAYVRQSRRHVEDLGDRACEVRFEDFLANPEPVAAALADFCGLDVTADRLTGAVDGIRADRAYAFAGNDELAEFARRVRPRLAAHGYDSEPDTCQP